MKLSFANYRNKFEYFTLTFDLLRHSLIELGDPGFSRFMKYSRRPLEANFAKTFEPFAKTPESSSSVEDIKSYHRREMSKKFPVTRNLKWAEYKGHAQLGLNASELIIRVSLFEAFLKEIHRHALAAKPQLIALSKPNRPIPLKDVFRGSLEGFKMREIDRQVREVDRLTTKERAKFFARRLKLAWGTDAEIAAVADITELRHDLVHKSPELPVTDKILMETRQLLLSIPDNCFNQAARHYALHFEK